MNITHSEKKISNKGLISKTFNKLIKINSKKNQRTKLNKQTFTQQLPKDIQMAN